MNALINHELFSHKKCVNSCSFQLHTNFCNFLVSFLMNCCDSLLLLCQSFLHFHLPLSFFLSNSAQIQVVVKHQFALMLWPWYWTIFPGHFMTSYIFKTYPSNIYANTDVMVYFSDVKGYEINILSHIPRTVIISIANNIVSLSFKFNMVCSVKLVYPQWSCP